MSFLAVRAIGVISCAASLGLISCSTPRSSAVGTPDYYWSAARELYAAGDYVKTLDDLEHVLGATNSYTTRAIPWYLTVTAGMARGYMDLAERYTMGARINKASALAFRRRATQYQKAASGFALRFAQAADRFGDVPLGKVPLAFAFPKGSAAEPAALSRIASGIEPTAAEQENAETLAVERGVLLAVCAAAGAPNDMAKAREILEQDVPAATRAVFGDAMADMLKEQAALFRRDKLDDPEKAAVFEERAERARVEAARVGSARIGLVVDR